MFAFTTDSLGFPMVTIDVMGLDVHLFPVTKLQFEMFLAEPNPFADRWYETILELNPRSSSGSDEHLERVFLTGILPDEATQYATWLGDGFRLPTAAQWQAIYQHFKTVRRPMNRWSDVRHEVDGVAAECLKGLWNHDDAVVLSRLARMEGGVMEWVRARRGWQLIGQPRPEFGNQLFSCRTTVTPINVEKRNPLCGFRLVRDHKRSPRK